MRQGAFNLPVSHWRDAIDAQPFPNDDLTFGRDDGIHGISPFYSVVSTMRKLHRHQAILIVE
jgi:hypothetical protein